MGRRRVGVGGGRMGGWKGCVGVGWDGRRMSSPGEHTRS